MRSFTIRRAAGARGVLALALAFASILALAGSALAASPNSWSPTGSLSVARSLHAAAPLPSGSVLAAGGFDGTNYQKSAEIYDPATGTWRSTRSMANGRSVQAVAVLSDGRVMQIGGFANGGYLASVEIFSPATETWASASSMGARRSGATATVLGNGKVLVTGGYQGGTGYLQTAEVYDPVANTWTPTANAIGTRRALHTASLLPNGKVLIAGGLGANGPVASSAIYDPSTNSFSPAGSLGTARAYHTSTTLPGGMVLVAGGFSGGTALASAELYNPSTDRWSPAGGLSSARGQHTATLLSNGRVLVVGGLDSSDSALRSAEQYDSGRNAWSSAGTLAVQRGSHTATVLTNGLVLVDGGGMTSTGALKSSELYTPQVVPSSPTNVRAVAGGNSAKVSWDAPASDGGAPIISYRVQSDTGGADVTVSGDSTTTGISGLQNGQTYTFTVTASNDLGPSPSSEPSNAVTPVAGLPQFGPGPGATAPVLTRLRIAPNPFRVARKGLRGARVAYRLSAKAKVTFRVQKVSTGLRRGSKCVTTKRAVSHKRRCIRNVYVKGAIKRSGHRGNNKFRFKGRIGGRALRPGKYRLVARPVDSAGRRGRAVTKRFAVRR